MMMAVHVVMTTIHMCSASTSKEDLLAEPAGANGVGHLWGKRKRMDLRSVGTFVQMMRKLRRR